MRRLLSTLLAAALLGACTQPGTYIEEAGMLDTVHPATKWIQQENAAGRYGVTVTIESVGGNIAGWMGLAAQVVQPGSVGMVKIARDCDSACLMFVLTVSGNKENPIPVYVRNGTALIWDGPYMQSVAGGKKMPVDPIALNAQLAVFQVYGMPQWVVDTIKSLAPGEHRSMTPAEVDRSDLRKYQ